MEHFPIYLNIIIQIVTLLIAVIGHEIMHGLVALKYGDTTAKDAHRLTINPIPHIDLIGSIILPLALLLLNTPFMIGYAKPVPVNMNTVIKNGGYKAAFFVSMAGIIYNLGLAIVAAVALKFEMFSQATFINVLVYVFLLSLFQINIVLAIFNILPIPPLDGSKALAFIGLMAGIHVLARFYNSLERYGIIIILLIIATPISRYLGEFMGFVANGILRI
ncbi:hypothetical protein BKH43_07235 [Helicobacter sp. 13S00401-1]|uniref:site-2 protease family protein n=1 Tax=Helicobacter sp. 13S00401-1 TaxID=1905758 RepID=UPI000BA6C614|nr:site-2 protease family protein [Helicobacter sp. 13S00401-1]PAF49034.1 hypothetical protein BKH43_07235 [Helicobacter sp. 13S00401-1]